MADFGIRFFLCNILLGVITVLFLLTKYVLRNRLPARTQFCLWFPLLVLFAVPFIPAHPAGFSRIFLLLDRLKTAASPSMKTATESAAVSYVSGQAAQIQDFTLSVSGKVPSVIGLILFGIWLIGLLITLLFFVKSMARLRTIEKSALPLQNNDIRIIYNNCLTELHIRKNIPVYSTAFLKSPVMTGLFRPRIYLPIHLISDFSVISAAAGKQEEIPETCSCFHPADIRYILLHELQHYKQGDALTGAFMNLISILYWFNPVVRYALKEMRSDREIACDASVLGLLSEKDYTDYGNTLLHFAEKASRFPLPFAAGISSSMKQMQKRILHISSYQKPSYRSRIKGIAVFCGITIILSGLAPMLPSCAADGDYYKWNTVPEQIDQMDLSAYFAGYEGSLVLYSQKDDTWRIYNMEQALCRTAPDSTYKIYDALFGLDAGIITPEDSLRAWNGIHYPFAAWNRDQNLDSAMASSVNWYFQEIDRLLGASAIKNYLRKTSYGNQNTAADLSSYWLESSLKISPVEQVELLTKLYTGGLDFAPEYVDAVKESVLLSSSVEGNFYGKTGTGRIDGKDVNGWFIGCIETDDNTCFFAVNIKAENNASGTQAAEIALSVLADAKIWNR